MLVYLKYAAMKDMRTSNNETLPRFYRNFRITKRKWSFYTICLMNGSESYTKYLCVTRHERVKKVRKHMIVSQMCSKERLSVDSE